MPFLKPLMQEFDAVDKGGILVAVVNGKPTEVAKCNYKIGKWELLPAGEKLLAKLPPQEEIKAPEYKPVPTNPNSPANIDIAVKADA